MPTLADHAISAHAGCSIADHTTDNNVATTGSSTLVKSKAHTVTQANAHSDLSHDTPSILNPYYALAFIMRIS